MVKMLVLNRMFKAALCLIVLMCLLPLTARAADNLTLSDPAVNDQPNIAVGLSLTDEHGLPVTDLEPGDITVLENGVQQPDVDVFPFYQRPTPVNAVLALDTSASMKGQPFKDSKAAATAFVYNLGPDDHGGLVGFGHDARLLVPLTTDRAKLVKAIDASKLSDGTALNDALVIAAQEASRGDGPRVVVLMSDGANWHSKLSEEEALNQVRSLHIPVYTIAFGKHANAGALQKIADDTGGKFYQAADGDALKDIFGTLSRQLHQDYQLSYRSITSDSPGAPVTVTVKVHRQGVESEATFTYTYAVRENAAMPQTPIRTGNLPVVNPGKAASDVPATPFNGFLPPVAAGFAVLALLGGLLLAGTPSRTQRRLFFFVDPYISDAPQRTGPSLVRELTRPVVRFISNLVLRILPSNQQRKMVENLAAAGHPFGWRLSHYVTMRVTCGVVVGLLAVLVSQQLLLALVGFLLGFILPEYWLGRKVRSRRNKIRLQLPDALDLLTISVEAGLGFDGAMMEVTQKWDNEIAQEFSNVISEVRLGKSRRDALRAMSARAASTEMQTFVSAIVQADEVGMSIGHTLTLQAEQMRLRRRQKAEELAHKAVIKIIFPMVMFIFPSIFIVLLGPAVPTIMHTLQSVAK